MATVDIARRRLRNQRLAGNPLGTPAEVIRWFGAVQAQDYGAAKWGVAQRTRTATDAAIDQLLTDGTILRTHVLRPTWHFVMPEDIRWLLKLTAPRVHAAMAYYNRKLELDASMMRDGMARLIIALEDGECLTRAELATRLRGRGPVLEGQRLGHLLMYAELEALVCSGGLRGRQFTYALLDQRVPAGRALERDQALAELTRRYFQSHGPATLQDFAWWSGLTVADARTGVGLLETGLEPHIVDGKTYWSSSAAPAAGTKPPTIHLLPNFDEHLVAYRDHSASYEPPALQRLRPEAVAPIRHVILRRGRVIGGWRRSLQSRAVTISTDVPVALGRAEVSGIAAAARRYGRFLGTQDVTVVASLAHSPGSG